MSRVRIRELRLRNFRSFADARLVLDDVTFLIGRNGAGKSTLMDAFAFISEAVTDSLATALERRGGLTTLMNRPMAARMRRSGPYSVSVAVRLEVEDNPSVLYGFTMKGLPGGKGDLVRQEYLVGDPQASFRRDGDSFVPNTVSLKPVINQGSLILPLIAGSNALWEAILLTLRNISVYQLSPPAIRHEPEIESESRLRRDGRNAGDVLKHLKPVDRRWIDTYLAAAISGLRGVQASARTGRRVLLFEQDGDGDKTYHYDSSMMSDGTLRILGTLLALRQSPRPSIVLLDEIEDSLHPYAHGVILDAVEEASEDFPVVVSTHSPEILNYPLARGDRIRVIEWGEGESRIYCLTENVRANLKPPLTVGQLLRSNALWTDDIPSTTGPEDDFFNP